MRVSLKGQYEQRRGRHVIGQLLTAVRYLHPTLGGLVETADGAFGSAANTEAGNAPRGTLLPRSYAPT